MNGRQTKKSFAVKLQCVGLNVLHMSLVNDACTTLLATSNSSHPCSMPHSNITRVSEDFYPALPASHTAHIANAAFATLLLGVVAFPDWDM